MKIYFIQSLHEPTDWEIYDNKEEFADSVESHRLEIKEWGGTLNHEIQTIQTDCDNITQLRSFLKQIMRGI